jgi:transcriptional regulator with XRE-family HTH domain
MTSSYRVNLLVISKNKYANMKEPDLLIKMGERIKDIRMKKKMTQNDLAIDCQFEKASMSRLESGRSNPTVRTLQRVCKALDVDIIELFKDQ